MSEHGVYGKMLLSSAKVGNFYCHLLSVADSQRQPDSVANAVSAT